MKSLITKMLLMFFASMLFFSCSSKQVGDLKSASAELVADVTSKAVAAPVVLDCSNPAAIKRDVLAKLMELDFFKEEAEVQEGLISQTACRVAVSTVLPSLIKVGMKQIPEDWSCSGDAAKLKLEELARSACAKL